MATAERLRIGELGRRVGVSPELLRAWEARYKLVAPERTPGGLRLYSAEDEIRVRLMKQHVASGVAPAEAAIMAKASAAPELPETPRAELSGIAAVLRAALDGYDEPSAQAALDRLFGTYALDSALSEVILPFLHELGERWACAEATVAQEHFASGVILGRLWSLARGWDQGTGPRALLACPPGELHEMGLLCFGLVLRARGWRIVYLGADMPPGEVHGAARASAPAVVVLSATEGARFEDEAERLRPLAGEMRLAIGGAGAEPALAARLGAELLEDDPVAAATALAEELSTPARE